MNINNLPSEILEKILVEGNFLSVSKVNQTWRYHAKRKKSQFNEVFFDLTKDDPEKIEKKNPNQLFVFNSPSIDKNGFRMGPEIVTKYRENYVYKYSLCLKEKYEKILNKITSTNTLNYIYDPLLYVNRNESQCYSKKYILSDNVFVNNEDGKTTGIINYYPWKFEDYLYISKNKIKKINIVIKDVCDRVENIDQNLFFQLEINMMREMIHYQTFKDFKKFTFKAPNNTYLIYDENKKILIIRFGNYEKYNFPMEKISISNESNIHFLKPLSNYKRYSVNSFMHFVDSNFIVNFYPAKLFEYDYEKATEKVETLIIISSELYVFMFDQLWEISKIQKDKEIKYYCLDPSKMKFKQKNFEFIPVEKEKAQEYSFEQMHFKYFGENAF